MDPTGRNWGPDWLSDSPKFTQLISRGAEIYFQVWLTWNCASEFRHIMFVLFYFVFLRKEHVCLSGRPRAESSFGSTGPWKPRGTQSRELGEGWPRTATTLSLCEYLYKLLQSFHNFWILDSGAGSLPAHLPYWHTTSTSLCWLPP